MFQTPPPLARTVTFMRGRLCAADYAPGRLSARGGKNVFEKNFKKFFLFQVTVFFSKQVFYYFFFPKTYYIFSNKSFFQKKKTFFKQKRFILIKILISSKLFF